MPKVIIAEKPSLGRNIAAAIGKMSKKDGYFENENYIVTWAFGHLFSPYDIEDYTGKSGSWTIDSLPFVPTTFQFTLRRDPKTKAIDSGIRKQFNTIKSLVLRNDVSEIINAGDSDREGEIIIRLILQNIPGLNKPVYRLWMPDQTTQTISTELRKLRNDKDYDHLANEGFARMYMDWLYGINLTRYASVKSQSLLRVGRVTSPIIKAIFDRDMEIENFVPVEYYAIVSQEKTNGGIVELVSKTSFPKGDTASALELCKKYNSSIATVTKVEKSRKTLGAGKLYSLSNLQSALGQVYKMPLKESLDIVQKLYENGYVTYPRTNTEYLATSEKDKIKDVLNAFSSQGFPVQFKDSTSIFNDSKIESHSALTPTSHIPLRNDLTDNEWKVYEAIRNRFLAVFCSIDCIIDKTTIVISVGSYENFTLRGEIVLQKGWLEFALVGKKDRELPNLSEGDRVNINFKPVERKTSPPAHYTLSTFNKFLKNPFRKAEDDEEEEYKAILNGIELGTEATRTEIINRAIRSNYIALKGGSYYITDIGKYYVKALEALQIDMSKEKTVQTSALLKQVYKGEANIQSCITFAAGEIDAIIKKNCQTNLSAPSIGKCPVCGGEMRTLQWGYGCENHKNGCEFSISKKIAGKTITESQIQKLLTAGITDEINGFKSKEGKSFSAKLKVENGKVIFDFFTPSQIEIPCPCCKGTITNEKWAWKCACGFSFSHEIAGKKMSEKHLQQLSTSGATEKISGFKSKAGKAFSASLIVNPDKKTVDFCFDK